MINELIKEFDDIESIREFVSESDLETIGEIFYIIMNELTTRGIQIEIDYGENDEM